MTGGKLITLQEDCRVRAYVCVLHFAWSTQPPRYPMPDCGNQGSFLIVACRVKMLCYSTDLQDGNHERTRLTHGHAMQVLTFQNKDLCSRAMHP